MADSKITHAAHTLQTAEEVGGMKMALTRAALGELDAVIVTPFIEGYAVPFDTGDVGCGLVRDGVYWVQSEHARPSESRVILASGLWRIGGGDLAKLVADDTAQADFLFPFAGNTHAPAAPWEDWALALVKPLSIARENLWFVTTTGSGKDDLALPPAPPSWIAEAREHYTALKAEYPNLSKQQLAAKIQLLMKAKGRGGRDVSAGNILRNALQSL